MHHSACAAASAARRGDTTGLGPFAHQGKALQGPHGTAVVLEGGRQPRELSGMVLGFVLFSACSALVDQHQTPEQPAWCSTSLP